MGADTAGGRGEHEFPDPARVLHGQLLRDGAPVGEAEHVRGVDLAVIQYTGDKIREIGDGDGDRGERGHPGARRVEGNDPAVRKLLDQVVPHLDAAAETHDQQ